MPIVLIFLTTDPVLVLNHDMPWSWWYYPQGYIIIFAVCTITNNYLINAFKDFDRFCQPCSCECSSVIDTGAFTAAGLTVSLTLEHSQLQGWQCNWHWSIHSCRVDSITDTGAFTAAGLTVSLTLEHSQLQGWQCHWHWSIHSCRVASVTNTGASIATGLTVSLTLEHP